MISKTKKKLLLFLISSSFIVGLGGCGILLDESDAEMVPASSTTDLVSGNFYIWHDPSAKTIEEDLHGVKCETNVFYPMYEGNYTFKNKETSGTIGDKGRIYWALNDSEHTLDEIPTFYEGDELIYYDESTIPQVFTLERFSDEGNTFGIAGLTELKSGRYSYTFTDEKIYGKSDMARVAKLQKASESCIFDKISSVNIDSSIINDSGMITGVDAGKSYNFNIYAGTIEYNADIVADTRAFVSMEAAYTFDYDLLEAEIAVVKLPSYLKTGYYFINGNGLFRYISSGDKYDENTNFNEPMLIYNEDEKLISCPEGYVDSRGETPMLYNADGTAIVENTEDPLESTDEEFDKTNNENEPTNSIDPNEELGEDTIETEVSIPSNTIKFIVDITYTKKSSVTSITASPSLMVVSPGGGIQTLNGVDGLIKKEIDNPENGKWKFKILNAKYYDIDYSYEAYDSEGNSIPLNNTNDLIEEDSTQVESNN